MIEEVEDSPPHHVPLLVGPQRVPLSSIPEAHYLHQVSPIAHHPPAQSVNLSSSSSSPPHPDVNCTQGTEAPDVEKNGDEVHHNSLSVIYPPSYILSPHDMNRSEMTAEEQVDMSEGETYPHHQQLHPHYGIPHPIVLQDLSGTHCNIPYSTCYYVFPDNPDHLVYADSPVVSTPDTRFCDTESCSHAS